MRRNGFSGLGSLALGIFAMVWLGASCSPSVSRLDDEERSQPLIQKARAKANQGDVRAAVRLYNAALDFNPKLAVAHLDLALLLHENEEVRDYVRAIYHYQRYLELRPTTEKRQMIEERIRLARQMLVAALTRTDRIVDFKEAVDKENEQLKARIAELESEVAILRGRVSTKSEPAAVVASAAGSRQTELPSASLPAVTAQKAPSPQGEVQQPAVSSPGATAPSPSAGSASGAELKPIRTYRVKRGDTLTGIAAEVYGDPNQWKKIYNANRRVLGGSTGLKVGQVLVIP